MSTPVDPRNLIGFRTFNNYVPKEGPKALFVPLDFTVITSYLIDLETVEQDARLEFVQAIYADNSANAQIFTFKSSITGQTLSVPASKQAYLPILAPPGAKFTVALAIAGAGTTNLYFLNFFVPPFVW